MRIVFFQESFNERAPALMGHLLSEQSGTWLSLNDVFDLLRAGELVEIRQADAAEMQRAEGLIDLHEVSQMLGEKMRALLDQDADRKMETLAAALSLINIPLLLNAQSVGEEAST